MRFMVLLAIGVLRLNAKMEKPQSEPRRLFREAADLADLAIAGQTRREEKRGKGN